jgi:hypothetical protein
MGRARSTRVMVAWTGEIRSQCRPPPVKVRCGTAPTVRAPRVVHAGPVDRTRVVAFTLLLVAVWAAATAARDAGATWTAGGEVRYEARDALSAWSGVAEIADLVVTLDPEDLRTLRLAAVVQPASFSSGNFLRDLQARREVFQVDDHPEIRLTARAADRARHAPPGAARLVTDDLVRVSVTAWAHPDPGPSSTTR